MAEDNELEVRDLNESDDKPYLTKPTSQVDLERRLDEDYKPGSDVSQNLVVNPNPFGADDYASTDPIYQNYANETEKPLRAEEGADKQAEDVVRELHNTDDVDDSELAEDPGMGGVAVKADNTGGAGPTRYLVPGQEGYDREKAEELNAPPLRADAVESNDSDESSDQGVTEVPNEGWNFGESTQPPAPDETAPGEGNAVKTGNDE